MFQIFLGTSLLLVVFSISLLEFINRGEIKYSDNRGSGRIITATTTDTDTAPKPGEGRKD